MHLTSPQQQHKHQSEYGGGDDDDGRRSISSSHCSPVVVLLSDIIFCTGFFLYREGQIEYSIALCIQFNWFELRFDLNTT